MTPEKFKIQVDELFSEYKNYHTLKFTPNDKHINKNIVLLFGIVNFGLMDRNIDDTVLYKGNLSGDYEKILDDLIIFKELILPRYL